MPYVWRFVNSKFEKYIYDLYELTLGRTIVCRIIKESGNLRNYINSLAMISHTELLLRSRNLLMVGYGCLSVKDFLYKVHQGELCSVK